MPDLTAPCDWHDSDLRLQLPELPDRIKVTLPDKRGREVYSAKVHEYVPSDWATVGFVVEPDSKAARAADALAEIVIKMKDENDKMQAALNYLWSFAKCCGVTREYLQEEYGVELGIEVDG